MSTLAQEERAFDCRCLPTLQLEDAIWQVIFEELPADVAKYLQRQFFAQGTVQDLQRVFKGVRAPARSAKKLWVPSFCMGQWRRYKPLGSTTCVVGGGIEKSHQGRAFDSPARHAAPILEMGDSLRVGQASANVRFLC